MNRRQRGFSLIELGIAIGVVGVLSGVVLMTRGFIDNGRLVATLQTVDTLRKAGREYATRKNGGRDFAGVSVSRLRTEGLVHGSGALLEGAWGDLVTINPKAGDTTWMRISACVPSLDLANDLKGRLDKIGTTSLSLFCMCAPGECRRIVVDTR